MATSGWAEAASIDDVLDRMASIDDALPPADGVATFNRMYRQVTRLVDRAVDEGRFGAGPFLERLDVQFANLYFAALRGRPSTASASTTPGRRCSSTANGRGPIPCSSRSPA